MDYRYILVTSTYSGGTTHRTSYGIALVSDYDDVMSILQTISDLSSDKASIERLVDDCNTLGLDPVHLPDIADDFLADL